MKTERTYRWEGYPEYQALQQYSRCLGAVIASAPEPVKRSAASPLIRAASLMSMSIAGAHAEEDELRRLGRAERETFRRCGLECAAVSRRSLRALRDCVSRPHLTAALELLERVESGIRDRPLPID